MTASGIARGADRALNAVEAALLGALLVLSVVVLVLDIGLRTFVNASLPWAAEATRYAIVWMVFIGGSAAARKGAHISIDALSEAFAPHWAARLVRAALVVSALSTATLAWISAALVRQMTAFNQLSPSLELPMWSVYLALPVGFALMTLRFVQAAFTPSRAASHAALAS